MSAFLRGLLVFFCLSFLAACQEEGGTANAEAQSGEPEALATARLACERDGGIFALTPSEVAFACFRNLPDAGKTCSGANDCQGLCLARSRTCAPIDPFYGCHEVLTAGGARQTRCLE